MVGLASLKGRAELRRVTAAASAVVTLTLAAGSIAHAQPAAPPQADNPPAATAPAAIPSDTPAGMRAAHILDLINGDVTVDPAAVQDWTDAAVLNSLGPDGLAAPLEQLRTTGPYEFVSYSGTSTAATVALKTRTGLPFELRIYVSTAGDADTVNGLLVRPQTPDIESFDDFTAALDVLGTDYAVLAAHIEDTTCVPVFGAHAERSMPMASVAKLYVLGAVADAVSAGDLRWDEVLTITTDTKSLPTGELQDRADGSTVTVREATEKMISLSDNTATDLLIHRLGREAVEAQAVTLGHHDPESLTPFPTTREAFLIGFGDPERREAWREADYAERLALLDSVQGEPLEVDETTIIYRPVYPDGVDWFGSQNDICAAYAHLKAKDTNVTDILALNPGLTLSSTDWSYTGFKGGTMPGVLATSWILTDNTGQDWYFGVQQSSTGAIGLAENLYTFEIAGKIMGRSDAAVLRIN